MKRELRSKLSSKLGDQTPSALRAVSPGVFITRKNRGTRKGVPLKRIALLFLLARPSAFRPVPLVKKNSGFFNGRLFFLAKNTLAEAEISSRNKINRAA